MLYMHEVENAFVVVHARWPDDKLSVAYSLFGFDNTGDDRINAYKQAHDFMQAMQAVTNRVGSNGLDISPGAMVIRGQKHIYTE